MQFGYKKNQKPIQATSILYQNQEGHIKDMFYALDKIIISYNLNIFLEK